MRDRIRIIFTTVFMLISMIFSGVFIAGTEADEETEKALIALESYKVNSEMLEAGGELNVIFRLKNMSETNAASNIIVKFTNSNGDVYPKEGELSQVYIEELEVGESAEGMISANIADKLQFKNHFFVTVSILYWDSEYGEGMTESTLRIPVKETNDVSFISIESKDSFHVDQKDKLSLLIKNRTIEDAEKLTIVVKESSDVLREYEIDNLPAGISNTVDFYFEFQNPGTRTLSFELLQEDDGENIILSKENIDITVTEATELERLVQEAVYGQSYMLIQYAIILTAVIIIFVLTLTHLLKRKVSSRGGLLWNKN